MNKIKVGINGFGRIGRAFLKVAWERPEIEIVAVNDLGSVGNMAYLLKYDTVYRTWTSDVQVEGNELVIDGRRVKVLAEKEPNKLPWKDLGVDVVVESTGLFTSTEKAQAQPQDIHHSSEAGGSRTDHAGDQRVRTWICAGNAAKRASVRAIAVTPTDHA